MENNKLITREYFNNEYLSEVTMIQDDDKISYIHTRMLINRVCFWNLSTTFTSLKSPGTAKEAKYEYSSFPRLTIPYRTSAGVTAQLWWSVYGTEPTIDFSQLLTETTSETSWATCNLKDTEIIVI